MKNGFHFNPVLFKMMLLVTCLMLAMVYNKTKGADTGNPKFTVEQTTTIP